MKRALLVVALLVAFVFVFNYVALAVNNNVVDGKAKNVHQLKVKFDQKKVSKLSKAEGAAQELPIIFQDDFESTEPHWIPDASWNNNDLETGKEYEPESSWHYVDTNSSSPTHSWNAVENLPQWHDLLISPVISLPEEVEVAGKTSPLKGLKIGYMLDVDTPDGGSESESWGHILGPVEVWWRLDDSNPGAGSSSHYLDMTDGSMDHTGRQWLITPDVDLTNASGTIDLSFMQNYETEQYWDYLAVEISDDDFLTYAPLGHWGEDGASNGWVNESFDISAWAGKVVKIRFAAKTDNYTREGFWALDEIKITDDNGDIFYDDGGESGSTDMLADGFVAAEGDFFGEFYSDAANPNPNWSAMDPLIEVPGFKTNFGPGSDIRMALVWHSDGDDPQGRGLFIDDVTLYGVGLLPQDIAVVGIKGLLDAALNRPFAPAVGVGNVGIEPLNGAVIWTANVVDADSNVVHVLVSGQTLISDFAADSVLWIPTVPIRAWVPMIPGDYTLQVKVIFADGDPTNNEAEFDVMVPGGPWATPLYRCDFEPTAGQSSLEDFGWTVVNGGGNDLTGLNDNKWEFIPFIYGGAATLSAFWGDVDPGPDAAAPFDSSEVLDEYLISPPIDVSMLNKHNTLGLQYYEYFRSGYPGYDDFGVAYSHFTIDWSADGGDTWNRAFFWADHDSLPGSGPRLPNYYYGVDNAISYLSKLDLDITPALVAAKKSGSNTVLLRFGTWCANSYFVASSLDEIMVYAGVSKPVIMNAGDVPDDQGKQAYLVFKGSYNDMVYDWDKIINGDVVGVPVVRYDLWRGNEVTGATTTATFANFKEMFDKVANPQKGDTYAVEDNPMVWAYVGSVPATDLKVYGATIPTLWDGVETAVMVVARTEVPDVWSMTPPVMVTTEDNLAPSAPGMLAVTTEEGMTKNVLAWEEAYTPVQDVNYYTIYRTEESGVYSEPLANTTDLNFVDETVEVGHSYYYVVTATDFAGNESDRSNESSIVTSVDSRNGSGVPTDFALEQNYPNPFNPSTTVQFALPKAGNVVLTVYNTSGQAIATVFDGYKEAGYHKINWDASSVSAGIYFMEMKAGSFTRMIKMTLVK